MELDATTKTLLARLKTVCQRNFGDNLVGVYVHGSLALGSYRREVSDLDYLIVLQQAPTLALKVQLLADTMRELDPVAPQKGLEFHVLTLAETLHGQHPYYFELHYSPMHRTAYFADPRAYAERMHGRDDDLATHLKVTREHGIVLLGQPLAAVFGAVPEQAYLDSVLADIDGARTDILQAPVYTTLNLCRSLAYLTSGQLLSKRGGGEWVLAQNVAVNQDAVRWALAAYDGAEQAVERPADANLRMFADQLLKLIAKRTGE